MDGGRSAGVGGGRSVGVPKVSAAPAAPVVAGTRQVVSAPPPAAAVSTRTVLRQPRTVVKTAPQAVKVGNRTIPKEVAVAMNIAAVPSAPPPAAVVASKVAPGFVMPAAKPPVPQRPIVTGSAIRRRHKQVIPPMRNRPTVMSAPVVEDSVIIDPALWGPPLWKILHTLAVKAEGDAGWPALLGALRTALPCPECSYHYNAWYVKYPVGSVGEWLRGLHNDVNRRNKALQWSADRIKVIYSSVTSLEAELKILQGKLNDAAYKLLGEMVGRVFGVPPAVLVVEETAHVAPAVLVIEETAPVVEETAPVVEETPVEETAPVVEETNNAEVSVPVEETNNAEVVAPVEETAPAE